MTQFKNIDDLPKHVVKYLMKHGNGKWKLELPVKKKYKMAVVVPAIMEFDNIKQLLASLIQNDKTYFEETLLVFVINNMDNSEEGVKIDNRYSIDFIRQIIYRTKNDDKFLNDIINSGLNIGLVDAASSDFQFDKKNGGVGLARKIGMDLALTIFNYDDPGKNILVCLDADCIVDANYLSEIHNSFKSNDYSGAYIKFRHKIYGDETVHHAMTCYELYMRYYVLGLKIAGSPFAFHTVGSTIACDTGHYIKAGGMSKQKGGEDFYFMEKLAKLGKIGYIDSTTVYPAGRKSWRVPFGTGPRVQRFSEQTHDEYLLYSFQSFLLLKKWLEIFHSNTNLSAEEYLEAAGRIDKAVKDFLEMNSFAGEWTRIQNNSKTEKQINKQKLLWFDGFRTLKFIHYLRDNKYPDENMFDVLDNLFDHNKTEPPFNREAGVIPQFDDQLKYLEILRDLA